MPQQIYRYQIQRLIGEAPNNEIFEAYDPVLDQAVKIFRWTPPADALESSLALLDSTVSKIRAMGADVFSEGASFCLATAKDDVARDALGRLRANGLFPGRWPGTVPDPPFQPPPPLASSQPIVEPLSPSKTAPAKRSGLVWILAFIVLVCVALAIALATRVTPSRQATASPSPTEPQIAAPTPIKIQPAPPEPKPVESAPVQAHPTFDCSKKLNDNERLICHDPHLADLEVGMAGVYDHLMKTLPADERETLRHDHLKWFLNYRNTCLSSVDDDARTKCIADSLETHKAELIKQYPE